jgi:hypothetical protein
LYVAQCEQGHHGEHKRYWGIKMNNAIELYLKKYRIIDTLDKYISNADIGHEPCKDKGIGDHAQHVQGVCREGVRSGMESAQACIISKVS